MKKTIIICQHKKFINKYKIIHITLLRSQFNRKSIPYVTLFSKFKEKIQKKISLPKAKKSSSFRNKLLSTYNFDLIAIFKLR